MKTIFIFILLSTLSTNSLADKAIFASGCFWCTESDFQEIKGVSNAVSGYIGGTTKNPTYQQVTFGNTGHYEAVEITFDPDTITYEQLLKVYWRNVDPFDDKGQFCDKGPSYRSAIFALNEKQKQAAEMSLKAVQKRFPKQQIATKIIDASIFYPAEDYHQDYYIKSASRYKFYRWNCGRDRRLEAIWGDQ